ncbi:MAG: rod shape-determining protein MreC [Candidatus Paceibacterota bacterium]
MKMNYLQQRNRQRRRRRFLSGLIIVVLSGTVAGVYLLAPQGITGTLHTFASPVWAVKDWVGERTAALGSVVTAKSSLQRENDELRDQLQIARVELGQRSIMEAENRLFRQMWGRASSTSGVLAAVLTTPPQSPHDLIVLDAGERQGVVLNDRVVFGDIGLGHIQEVYTDTAVAQLYSTTDAETRGVIVGEDVTIVMVGEGGGSFRAEIPRDVRVVEGDVIILPDSRSLEFARVVEVTVDPTDSFRRIRARSPLNIAQLRWVRIIDHNESLF